jgi:hypothetical protein
MMSASNIHLSRLVCNIELDLYLDTAKAIYYNVTLEKIALLHLMMGRERRSSEDNQQMKISLEVHSYNSTHHITAN